MKEIYHMRHVESLFRMSGVTKRFNEDIKSSRAISLGREIGVRRLRDDAMLILDGEFHSVS